MAARSRSPWFRFSTMVRQHPGLVALFAAMPVMFSCEGSSNVCKPPPVTIARPIRTKAITVPVELPGLAITDAYLFPNPNNANNVVLVLNAHPLILAGTGLQQIFDPHSGFQFKIDNTGDFVEDLVALIRFTGTSSTQQVQVYGPVKLFQTGTADFFGTISPDPVVGTINTPFTLSTGINVFAGAREEPFFFDLNAFFSMLPDRANPLGPNFTNINGMTVSTTPASPDQLQLTSFRPAGQAQDFFQGSNVLSMVLDVPKAMLGGPKIRMWVTTSAPTSSVCNLTQIARQARPLASTVFPTIANRRQNVNNFAGPKDDGRSLALDIKSFMTQAAGRSTAICNAVVGLFSPDVLVADLSQPGPATYLGVETNGATGGKFGGRALSDDVVDTLFGIIFGNTIPSLGLAPDDGKEIPALTSDHVNASGKHFQSTFPFLGPPV